MYRSNESLITYSCKMLGPINTECNKQGNKSSIYCNSGSNDHFYLNWGIIKYKPILIVSCLQHNFNILIVYKLAKHDKILFS